MDEASRYKPLSATPGPKMFSIFGSETKQRRYLLPVHAMYTDKQGIE